MLKRRRGSNEKNAMHEANINFEARLGGETTKKKFNSCFVIAIEIRIESKEIIWKVNRERR